MSVAQSLDLELPELGSSAGRPQAFAAFVAAAILIAASIVAIANGAGRLPEVHAFLPICVTVWTCADLMTALLLYSQFYVRGRPVLAIVASAYAFTAILSVPFLAAFPGVFVEAKTPADLQISAWLWALWHFSFPVFLAAAHIYDPTHRKHVVPRAQIMRVLIAFLAGTFGVGALVVALVSAFRDRLPVFIEHGGHFSALWTYLGPAIMAVNLFVCALVLFRLRKASPLQTWVAVALLTAALDGAVNASSHGRYTVAWYFAKIESLTTGLVVLSVLLIEIFTLYRRLADAANLDVLTGLQNRRALGATLDEILAARHQAPEGVAMFVLDLDHFKAFNDRYGHAGGDEALRQVALALRRTVNRSDDIVARFGGEEFVLVLPQISRESARLVGERVRSTIERLEIFMDGSTKAELTVSIGIAHVERSRAVSSKTLFEIADEALYRAKADGRNMVVVGAGDDRVAAT